jgi:hypothetical protein
MSFVSFIVLFAAVFTALFFLGAQLLPKTDNFLEKSGRISGYLLFTLFFVAIIPMGSGWYDGVTLSEHKEVQIYRTFKVDFVSDKMVVTSGDDVIYDGKRELLADRNLYFGSVKGPTNLSLNEDSYASGETEYTKSLKNSELVVTRVVREKFYIEPGKGFNIKKEKHTESFFAEEVVPRVSFSNK